MRHLSLTFLTAWFAEAERAESEAAFESVEREKRVDDLNAALINTSESLVSAQTEIASLKDRLAMMQTTCYVPSAEQQRTIWKKFVDFLRTTTVSRVPSDAEVHLLIQKFVLSTGNLLRRVPSSFIFTAAFGYLIKREAWLHVVLQERKKTYVPSIDQQRIVWQRFKDFLRSETLSDRPTRDEARALVVKFCDGYREILKPVASTIIFTTGFGNIIAKEAELRKSQFELKVLLSRIQDLERQQSTTVDEMVIEDGEVPMMPADSGQLRALRGTWASVDKDIYVCVDCCKPFFTQALLDAHVCTPTAVIVD